MPDLRQVLKDFVATSNSGKYATEQELLLKFPELKGYDVQLLRDFVATNNSGKYKTEDELFSKFPEFNLGVSTVVKKKDFSESVKPQSPQTPTTELPSEDGLSATPVIDKSRFSLTKEDLKKAVKKQPTDMLGKPLLPEAEKSQPIFNRIEKERSEKKAEQKKYADIFDKQVGVKPTPAESSYLKERLKSIDTDLINYEQEYIVPQLEYQFGDLGFKFEESGVIGDYVKATAPNGKTIEISADNLFSSKSKEQSEILKKFIAENTPAKGLFVVENTMREQDRKFNSQKEVDESIKSITNDVNLLNQKQKEILARKAKLDKDIEDFNSNPTPERLTVLQQQKNQLDADIKKILQEETSIKSKGLKLNQAVAKYGMSKARQGSWVGGIWDAFNVGVGKMSSGVGSLVIDLMAELSPSDKAMSPKYLKNISIDISKKIGIKPPSENQTIEEWKKTLTEDQLDQWQDEVDDFVKKSIKRTVLPYVRIGAEEIFGDPATTTQWADLKKEGFWGGAILGVSESLPAMIGGGNVAGWAQRTAQMYAQISDGISQEMENDPDFANISENEKLALTLPIGITSAVLEAYGLRNVMASKGVINTIALRAMGRAGAGTSARTFRELVQNEVDGMIAKGLITITAAGAAEFETGAAQELSETGFKMLYDEIKGKDMFNTPDSKLDLIENVLVAGAQEAVGGFILGVPSGVSVAYSKKGFLAMDDNTFETFASMANDTNIQSAFIADLKQKITQGVITQKEAKEQLNDYRRSVGLFRQLPEGLTTQQQKEAMNLLKEKRDLETYVEGKDAALVVKQKSRINEINDSLTKLSETNAVQEQSTTEVPIQSEAITSETMETGVSESGPEVVTEQTTQEVVIPEQHRAEHDARLESYERSIAELRSEIESDEKVNPIKAFFTDVKRDIKWKRESIKFYEDKIKLLKENPIEFFKQELNDIKESHEERIAEEADYKQRLMDEYGTTDFDVVYSDTVNNINRKISDYEAEQKTAEASQPIELTVEPEVSTEQSVEGPPPAPEGFDIVTEQAPVVETTTEVNPVSGTPVTEEVVDINELLNLDTSDKTNLQRVSDFLDGLDSALDSDANELNDVTRVMAIATAKAIVKTLKALVNAGITLQEAINNVSDIYNLTSDKIVEALSIVAKINENKAEGVSEFDLPGYNRMVSEIEGIVEKSKKRRASADKIADNVMKYVMGSKVYEDATDVQREALVREVRKRFGLKEKSAPSVGRLFGKVKDIKKITMTEKDALVKQIRDKARAAKDAIKAQREFAADLAKEVKDLQESGKITVKQAANIISKFSKVNVFSDSSVSNFIDYMSKIFSDADYDNKISIAKSKLKAAKKNIATKIGIADGLMMPLQTLMSINPNLIPNAYLNRYLELVDMFAERKAVLTLEEISTVTNDVNAILDEINNEQSLIEELTYRFENSPSLVSENGVVDYAETISGMINNNEITQDEADLMKKYKSMILPRVSKPAMTEQEIQDEKNALISIARATQVNTADLPTRDERDLAKKIASLLKTQWINQLSNLELQNLLKVIDNINNGYLPHYAQLIYEKIESIADGELAKGAIKKSKFPPISSLYAKLKSKITRKDYVLEMIRRSPLEYIDQVFGDFKTKDLFNAILRKSADAEARFTSEMKAIHTKLRKAEYKVAKSFAFNGNNVVMSKFKMMTYMIQLEYESNKGNSQVNPASEYLKKTIEHINSLKTKYSKDDAKMLEEILNQYSTDGEIDIEKLYNSFNKAEKEAIKTIRDINESLTEKAQFTAAVIRGQKMNPLNNYIHLNTLAETQEEDFASGQSLANNYNNSLQPSTKAKSLIERTKGAKPLNFDIFASAERGSKFVLMDYHLTGPIRTARKAINKAISDIEKEGPVSDEKRRVMNAISDAFKEAVANLIDTSYIHTSFGEQVANEISKQGYRAVLASTGRFVSEFLSNVGFVLFYGAQAFSKGLKHFDVMMSEDAVKIMNNVNSKEINRIFPSDTLSGRMIDQGIINQVNGITGAVAKGTIKNKAYQAWNLTGKKYKNAVEMVSDILITSPDKAIMRPVWFGNFASEFERLSGREITKEDFKKIAENNEQYMDSNKEIIEKAKIVADERSVITGASSNAFTGILKGSSNPNQSGWVKAFNNFNSFMTRFLIYEYTSARTGIMAAIGNGTMSKREGAALLAAVTTRMTVYSLLTKALGGGLVGLLSSAGDDEEEEKKSLDKAAGQALASTFTSLMFGRDFGNATKTVINYGIERINENHLEFLREGDYDPYKDQIQYTAVPVSKDSKTVGLYDYAKNMTGSFGPAINTADLAIRAYFGEDKKEIDAQLRQQKERDIRVPLEVLGNLGFVPLYKEIRKDVMKDIYKDLDSPKKEEAITDEDREELDVLLKMAERETDSDKRFIIEQKINEITYETAESKQKRKELNKAEKQLKETLLEGYENETDLKRYDPEKWEKNFGKGSDWYKTHKDEKEIDKYIREQKQKLKDEKYDYAPVDEDYKFGPQKEKSKKSTYKFGAQ